VKSQSVNILELGSSRVWCAVCELDRDNGITILASAETPCKGLSKGVISDLEETARAIGEVTTRIRAEIGGVGGEEYVVNINGIHLDGTNTPGLVPIVPKGRPISRDDVLQVLNHSRAILPPADREFIQTIPREFRVDGQKDIHRPIGMTGSRLEVVTHVITGKTQNLQLIEKAMAMAGCKVAEIVPQPLVSALGCLSQTQADQGTLVVDMGQSTTSIAIFTGGAIAYSAVLPVGSGHITSDLSHLLKVNEEEAERLKVKHGCAFAGMVADEDAVEVHQVGATKARHLQRKVLCEIIESRVKEILVLVRTHVDKSGLRGVLPGGVVFVGGGAKLSGLRQLSESMMPDLPAVIGAPVAKTSNGKQLSGPEHVAGVGLGKFRLMGDDEGYAPVTPMDQLKAGFKSLKSLFAFK